MTASGVAAANGQKRRAASRRYSKKQQQQPPPPVNTASLRARGLLAKNTPPCVELRVQLAGAELCAALSRAMLALAAAPAPGAPSSARGAALPLITTSSSSSVAASAAASASPPVTAIAPSKKARRTSVTAAERLEHKCHYTAIGARVASSALLKPLATDLCAHYGQHALRRGNAKPLGPAFRNRQRRAIGAHEGRAWRLWRRRVMARRWCRRCGVYLQDGVTTVVVSAGVIPAPDPENHKGSVSGDADAGDRLKEKKNTSKRVPKAHQVAQTRRVCRRCYGTQIARCARFQRAIEGRVAETQAAALTLLANEGTGRPIARGRRGVVKTAPDLSIAARRLAAACKAGAVTPMSSTRGTVDEKLLAHTAAALAAKCAVKKACRRKRQPSAVAKERAARAATKRRGAARTAVVIPATPGVGAAGAATQRVLLQAIPTGPIRHGTGKPKVTSVAAAAAAPSTTELSTQLRSAAATATLAKLPAGTAVRPPTVPAAVASVLPASSPVCATASSKPSSAGSDAKVARHSAAPSASPPTKTAASSRPAKTDAAVIPPRAKAPAPKLATAAAKMAPAAPTGKRSADAGKKKVLDIMRNLGF